MKGEVDCSGALAPPAGLGRDVGIPVQSGPDIAHRGRIRDVASGPDGAIYILEYGTNWFAKNSDARLLRIEYSEGNRTPVANIRVDNGFPEGHEVTVHYDPMLAKLIVWGKDRQEAIERMRWALSHYVVLGVTTNIEFLHRIVDHPKFVSGDIHTHFLDENPVAVADSDAEVPDEALIAAALGRVKQRQAVTSAEETEASPWQLAGGWRAV